MDAVKSAIVLVKKDAIAKCNKSSVQAMEGE
jgi:hypothetical protein